MCDEGRRLVRSDGNLTPDDRLRIPGSIDVCLIHDPHLVGKQVPFLKAPVDESPFIGIQAARKADVEEFLDALICSGEVLEGYVLGSPWIRCGSRVDCT
jgi:hypothetical protein